MKVNQKGLDLIKEFEGFRSAAYRCPAGVWTIGFGHTKTAKPGMVVSRLEGENLLKADLAFFETGVWELVKNSPTTENQFSAMVSLAFNIGLRAFRRSQVLRSHLSGQYQGAAVSFANWRRAGGRVLAGLVRRRAAEAKLYAEPSK